MISRLVVVGLTHRTAPAGVRERCVIEPENLAQLGCRLRTLSTESLILSTCGRFEWFAVAPDDALRAWRREFARLTDHVVEDISPYLRELHGADCGRHLLRVAAGLDSQITGEDHIQQQVRAAVTQWQNSGTCGPILSALARAAVRSGKRVRHETDINRVPRSFARLAVEDLARHDMPRASATLILGSGTMAREVAHELHRRGRRQLMIAGRDPQRTEHLAATLDARAMSLQDIQLVLPRVAAVFGCTSAPAALIRCTDLIQQHHHRRFYDLGLPRNIDPRVATLARTAYQHLDDLAPGPSPHSAACEHAEAIVEQEWLRFVDWYKSRQIAPLVQSWLQDTAELPAHQTRAARRLLHQRIMKLRDEVVV